MPYGPSDSAQNAFAVTKSDTTVYPTGIPDSSGRAATKALYIGGTGDVAVTMTGSNAQVTFVNVQGGSIIPISVSQVRSTSTTATSIVGLF